MSLYTELAHHQRPTHFPQSSEYDFYKTNVGLLADYEQFAPLMRLTDSFDVVRANILIRALLNKRAIEKAYKDKLVAGEGGMKLADFMTSRLSELPYLLMNDEKIYVPLFSRSINQLYSESWAKLAQTPYVTILKNFEALAVDPFDYYGLALYDSYFTKLVVIKSTAKEMAAYDFDADALYFINDEGRLDARLCLFDNDLAYPQKTHMMARLMPLVDAYFAEDREALLKALVDNRFISGKLIHEIAHVDIPEPPLEKVRP
jgi:hypothetical protein